MVFPVTANHVSHLEHTPDEQLNRLLSIVVDIENLFLQIHREEDSDTKQVYFYLFKVSILSYKLFHLFQFYHIL